VFQGVVSGFASSGRVIIDWDDPSGSHQVDGTLCHGACPPGGAQGPQGAIGPVGPAGSSLTIRSMSKTEKDSLRGPQGFQGLSLRGVQGRVGIQGIHGFQGLFGFQGRAGREGKPGPQGLSAIVDVREDYQDFFDGLTLDGGSLRLSYYRFRLALKDGIISLEKEAQPTTKTVALP